MPDRRFAPPRAEASTETLQFMPIGESAVRTSRPVI